MILATMKLTGWGKIKQFIINLTFFLHINSVKFLEYFTSIFLIIIVYAGPKPIP